MTTPTVLPSGFVGTSADYRHAQSDSRGGARLLQGSVTVPASTAANAYTGLVPFRKGARLGYGSRVYTADLDSSTNVTMNIGYVYDDHTTYTSDPDAFVAASTAPQTGGMMEMTALAGMTWVAAADGWIVAQNLAQTTTEGALTFNLTLAYG